MAQLVYWGLQNYDHVPVVREGRQALVSQMGQMGLNMWHLKHHVCENYNPHKNGTECTGDHFYHCEIGDGGGEGWGGGMGECLGGGGDGSWFPLTPCHHLISSSQGVA